MKLPSAILGLVAFAAIGLASCGGGGGGGGMTPGITGGAQDPLVTAAPASTSQPLVPVPSLQAGIAFQFNGSLNRSDFYNYPAVNPLPANTASAQILQKVTVTEGNNPLGAGKAFDYHNVETDAYGLQTLPFTIDSFYALKTSVSPVQLLLLGTKTVDDQKNTTTVTYNTPQIVDLIPEAPGQAWANNPAGRYVTAYANGNTSNRLVDPNFAYNEQDVWVNVGGQKYPQINLTSTMHSDGSASVVLVFNEEGRVNYPNKSITDTYVMSKPTSAGILLSFSQYIVPVTGTPPPVPTPQPFAEAPEWFTSPLYSETNVDNGLMAIPSSCNVPKQFGKNGRQIVKTANTIDAGFGTVDTTTTTRYDVSNFGAVCVQITDVNNAFYDYALSDFTNQTPTNFFAFATALSQPLIQTTISQQLTLSTNGLHTSSSGTHTTSAAPISAQMIALAEQSVSRESQRLRVKRLEQELLKIDSARMRGGR